MPIFIHVYWNHFHRSLSSSVFQQGVFFHWNTDQLSKPCDALDFIQSLFKLICPREMWLIFNVWFWNSFKWLIYWNIEHFLETGHRCMPQDLTDDKTFLHDRLWISLWIKSISNELDITIHLIASQLSGHVALWHHQQSIVTSSAEWKPSKGDTGRMCKDRRFYHDLWIRYVL